ncbi:uncharacterized protein A1O5_05004 [Cladophialophora psammophila CBS 110553]|uniref:Uncharacterized protein n=1 Tax=Cladophialophora psammophila CBS 110553 TaxID=1182543 RepID=W9XQ90_9EURO|nr:uncharacterized protein A1O5_05004 [Cladophialophora psammophila CBS 110553]EXJ72499.1 hypothetical protein A1O5_05004 [Cladophialophora psammophila CBS 110553]
MANIMLSTFLCLDDESMSEAQTQNFVPLLTRGNNTWQIKRLHAQARALPGNNMDMSRSVVGIGWMPSLYCTAIKCRVHQTRLYAVGLLETTYRECIWDAKIVSCGARKVMEVKEGDFYQDTGRADHFMLSSPYNVFSSWAARVFTPSFG